jgi:hypothetical protein
MEALHAANSLYWKKGKDARLRDRVDHEFRQERLHQIRAELAQLNSFRI